MPERQPSAREVDAIFAAALEEPSAERRRFLADACDGRPDVRERVEELLELADTPDRLLARRQG